MPAKSEIPYNTDNISIKQSEKSFMTGFQNDASSLSGNSVILTDNLKDRLTRSVSNGGHQRNTAQRDDASAGANSAYGPTSAVTGATDYDAVASSGLIQRLFHIRDQISVQLQKMQDEGVSQDYKTL